MYRIDTPDAVREIPIPQEPGLRPNSYFTNGKPETGELGTILQADWANAVQEEICNVVESAGVQLDKKKRTQLHNIIQGVAADMASAPTVNLGEADGYLVHITGTTTITSFGTPRGNFSTRRMLRFRDALILKYHAQNLILPGNSDITTASNDIAEFHHIGNGQWICTRYSRASGLNVATPPSRPERMGYAFLTNRILVQWGDSGTESGRKPTRVIFPIVFPNKCLQIVASDMGDAVDAFGATVRDNSGFDLYSASGHNARWIAIGH